MKYHVRDSKGKKTPDFSAKLFKQKAKGFENVNPSHIVSTEATPSDTITMMVEAIPTIQDISLPLNVLKEITKDFSTLIGEGIHGKVYCGFLIRSEKVVAIKKLNITDLSEADFLKQVSILRMLQHENVTNLLGYCSDGGFRILAYEYASKGSLHEILHGCKDVIGEKQSPALPWAERVKIAIGAAKGLEYLHSKANPHLVHGNFKSRNILLFIDHHTKITDIDFSDQDDNIFETRVCFYDPYHSPEYMLYREKSPKSDIYSFGVFLLELLTGRKPIDESLPRKEHNLVVWATPKLTEKVLECVDPRLNGEYSFKSISKMASITAACLRHHAEDRPNMSFILQELQQLFNDPPSETTCMY